MRLTNKLGLPQPIFDAVANDPYSKGDADYSVTGLLRPPRITQLSKQYWDEMEEDCADRLYSLFGQITHGILERSERVAIAERRLSITIGNTRISGAMDRFVYLEGLLQDYKLTSIHKVAEGLPREFIEQQNCYVFLLRSHGYVVKRSEIVALFRDWHKGTALRNPDYPALPAVVLNVPLWPDEQTRAFIEERIRIHREAEVSLPLCTDEDRWASPEQFAIYKAGGKRSVASYATRAEAEEHVVVHAARGVYEVRHKKSENKRCAGWCGVSKFCTQWEELRGK